MSRYADVIELFDIETVQDSRGVCKEERVGTRSVFANKYSVGAATWVAARAAGLKADASFSIRSCEYLGEEKASYNGVEYDIEAVSDKGEFTVLTLARRANNA